MDSQLKKLSDLIKAGGVVAFTGAGISVSAGIPPFRGDDGIWQRYPPETFGVWGSLQRLLQQKDPRVLSFINEFYGLLIKAKPTVSHRFLARCEEKKYLNGVITQNIDDLHREAGSRVIAELHGNALEFVCTRCRNTMKVEKKELKKYSIPFTRIPRATPVDERWGGTSPHTGVQQGTRGGSRALGQEILSEAVKEVPYCRQCQKMMRINIIFFHDPLPESEFHKAEQLIRECTTLLCIGTSAQVYPAAQLPYMARDLKKTIVEINLESALGPIADIVCERSSDDIFKDLDPLAKT